MLDDIRLYINDREVDLGNDPKFYYNWQLTDFENPLATKNSYSKNITLPGTKTNNDIMGHFWKLDRVQDYGSYTGPGFNPTYQIPFSIFINGDMFEKGYAKLNNVKYDNGDYTYEISLFGGLGSFLYNIGTDWTTGEKKTLADLNYYVEDTLLVEPTSNFIIDKDTVKNAWENIDTYSSEWSVINFAPAYNGLSDKMDTDKAIVNYAGDPPFFESGKTEDNVNYRVSSEGFSLATLPGKLTEWEVCDLRSWCQRPVIRSKAIIDAICRKENNTGKFDNGYEVVLDPEFFNTRNPYYEDTWMTLPLISSLNIKTQGEEETPYSATYTAAYTGTNYVELVYALNSPIEKFGTTAELNFDLSINVSGDTLDLYPSGVFSSGNSRQLKFTNVYALQGLATTDNTEGKAPMAGTDVYWLEYNRTDRQTTLPYTYENAHNKPSTYYTDGYTPRFDTEDCQTFEGHFVKNGSLYRWNSLISMSIPLPIGATSFRIRVDRKQNRNFSTSGEPRSWLFKYDYYWPQDGIVRGSTMSPGTVISNRDFKVKVGDLTSFFSGVEVKVKQLLGTSFTPAQWLMDYCRMFGLYIHKDLYDDKIYIDTRNTFFKRAKVNDISKRIDYSQDIEITPTVCESGYYRMQNTFYEGGAYKDYKDKYGKVYGSKIINTGYEFNADTKDIITSVFRGCVQKRDDSIYYFKPILPLHPYVFNGLKYTLWANGNITGDTIELDIAKKQIVNEFLPFYDNLPYYDIDDKPEFCDEQKKPLDGSGVMLFRCGDTDLRGLCYYLTDDLDIMSRLNNKPCWLLTTQETDHNNNVIAREVSSIPHFSRYWFSTSYLSSASTMNNILYSLDFGSPRELYLLNYINYDNASLFSMFYKDYLEDLYDVNTKQVALWFKPNGILDADALREFWWFDNCIWRINRIIDYSPTTNELARVELVKVNDLGNMTNEIPSKELVLSVVLDRITIDGDGGTIIGTVHTSDYGPWSIEQMPDWVSISPLSDRTDGTFTITVPGGYYGPSDRVGCITVSAGDLSETVCFTQTPKESTESFIDITANSPIAATATTIPFSVNTAPGATISLVRGGNILSTKSVGGGATSNNFLIEANTGHATRTYTISGITTDNVATDSVQVVQEGTTPEPVISEYNVIFDDISVDTDHSDLVGWTLPSGSISILINGLPAISVGVSGGSNQISFDGPTTFTISSEDLGNIQSMNVDYSNLSWNTMISREVSITTTFNGNLDVYVDSQNNLAGGETTNIKDWASDAYIHISVALTFNTN